MTMRRRRAGGGRRDEILAVAAEVLAERGYAATRFSDVARASGVAVGTLQGYFGTRDDMLVEALRRSTDLEVAAMEQVGAELTGPWDRLCALIARGAATPVPVWRMLMEFWAAAAHDEELREHSLRLQARYRAPFLDVLAHGMDSGAFSSRRSVDEVTDVVVAALDGLLFPAVLRHDRPDPGGFAAVLTDMLAATLEVDR
ncbi:TetR/AcrR family transcriptional regulator [Amycolatopsis suaedae]|nr:TetR/AcrR family transcriptional regulator [Amycolatopsis suaedae]